MTNTPEKTSKVARGQDDRRSTVNPADSPAPSSPRADEDEVRRGEDKLDSVTTK